MTLTFPYRFAVVLFGEDGTNLGTVPAKRDWEPEHEWTRFYFQRRGQLGLDGNGGASAVLPLWERTLGSRIAADIALRSRRPAGSRLVRIFPTPTFAISRALPLRVLWSRKSCARARSSRTWWLRIRRRRSRGMPAASRSPTLRRDCRYRALPSRAFWRGQRQAASSILTICRCSSPDEFLKKRQSGPAQKKERRRAEF